MLSKSEYINTLKNKGFNETDILKSLNEMVFNMKSVTIGKNTLNCIYNGDGEWKFRGNNKPQQIFVMLKRFLHIAELLMD
jgi:hypothetical protein